MRAMVSGLAFLALTACATPTQEAATCANWLAGPWATTYALPGGSEVETPLAVEFNRRGDVTAYWGENRQGGVMWGVSSGPGGRTISGDWGTAVGQSAGTFSLTLQPQPNASGACTFTGTYTYATEPQQRLRWDGVQGQ